MSYKILITTYFFYPEIAPRAFRAYELAKEFSRQGHAVTIYIPDYNFDYTELEKQYRLKIRRVKQGFFLNKNHKRRTMSKEDGSIPFRRLRVIVNPYIRCLMGGTPIEYAFTLFKSLITDSSSYDMVISVGLPMSVHLGTGLVFFAKKRLGRVKIADYGDPYYFDESKFLLGFHKYIEKLVINKFNYIVVPTERAVSSYFHLKPKKCIKMIPHGFSLDAIKIAKYTKNDLPTFGYAGRFYENIRNPKELLEYLSRRKESFRFIIYTNKKHISTMACLKPYMEKLGDRLIFNSLIPREDCIYEFSKCDFLINVENTTKNQAPSKIADYFLTKRPVYNFAPDKFNPQIFEEFLCGNYSNALEIDISKYDIKKVASAFLNVL